MTTEDVRLEPVIRVMPETLANKIAAGEVVQRPAAAAKELIENSIDAGAGEVTLILKAAGRELIQVVDTGCGMSAEDALTCFRRHATSKIRTAADLERIRTLGFRGEALASIAAVAQVELKTKRAGDDAGVRVRIDGGQVVAQEPCAVPNGTSVAVRNLFYNVPARRNFLKSAATEFKHLVETFQFLALSNPSVAFTLIHDDNEVYRLGEARSPDFFEALEQRIRDLVGATRSGDLVPVEEATSYIHLRGLVGGPAVHRKSRGDQFLFVNGRYIKNRYLEHAVETAYESALPDGAHPFFALFLEMDPRHVDVNVHPTKAEVKFDDERGIYGFVRAVVKKALATSDLTPRLGVGGGTARPVSAPRPNADSMTTGAPLPRPVRIGGLPGSAPPTARTPEENGPRPPAASPDRFRGGPALGDLSERLYGPEGVAGGPGAPPAEAPVAPAEEVPPPPERFEKPDDGETPLWQLHGTYIATQIRSGLMLVDQTAAHERILYERALRDLAQGEAYSQQLLFGQTLEFSPADYELLQEVKPHLERLGFDLAFLSGRTVVVQGVPADLSAGEPRALLEDVLEQFKNNRDRLQLQPRENLARSLARRQAIKPGTPLDEREQRSLVNQLFQCRMPYASPSGHATLIKITLEELRRRFA